MTRLTRLSAAAQAHYVVLRSVPEISLIPFDKNIEKLFQIFSDGSRAYIRHLGRAPLQDGPHRFPRLLPCYRVVATAGSKEIPKIFLPMSWYGTIRT